MTTTTRRSFIKGATLGAGALAFPCIGATAFAQDLHVMSYGGSAWLGHYPAYLASKNGGFKKEGIDLKWESFGTSSSRMSALMAGNIDIAGTGAVSAIALMARGARQFYVIGVPENFGRVEGLFVRTGINTIQDLKGKTIGTTFASSAHMLVLDLLATNGLVPDKDINIVNVSAPELPAAIKSGQIDACATWTPYFNNISAMADMKLLADDTAFSLFKEFGVTPGPDVLVVRKSFADKNPQAVKQFAKAYFSACASLRDTPEAAAPVLVALTNLSSEDQLQTIKDADWYDRASQQALLADGAKFVTGLQKLADMLVTYKQIDHAPKVSDWVRSDFI
ncbi:MAG TPA: ABC transporter substrate-binding protein [Candidimonas sp.]|nr:ABC transporter substrate-binding protein [Candidimonas sp.]